MVGASFARLSAARKLTGSVGEACQIRAAIVSRLRTDGAMRLACRLLCLVRGHPDIGDGMSYDILKNLGLDHLDTRSPDFLKTLERMQREALQSLQAGEFRQEPERREASGF